MKTLAEEEIKTQSLPYPTEKGEVKLSLTETSMTCPNCGSKLEGRKCKLFCHRPGCGYMVACSEW
jgi:hypothetical protein